jgi:hypothetical protein
MSKVKPQRALAFCISIVLSGACIVAMASEGRCQATSQMTNKEIIELCNRHTKQSATSGSFDLNIISKLSGKFGWGKSKLIEVSESVFYLIGQEESDCGLLLHNVITKEEYRDNQARRLEALIALHEFRENAEREAKEKVAVKPANADPNGLLEELIKKLPSHGGAIVKRGGSDLEGPIGEQLNKVIELARKSRNRNF